MKMEREDIDIDNFIRERINGFRPQSFGIEPTPDFAKRAMGKIYRLERRRHLWAMFYGLTALWIFSPLTVRQLWLWIRNDYFSASNFPLGDFVVPIYHFLISSYGIFLLLAAGILVSSWFVLRSRRGEYGGAIRTT
jgi:hypothetical protein